MSDPMLLVLPLSESFSAVWAPLARECGLQLQLADSVAAFARESDAVGLIVAGGEETRLAGIFRDLPQPRGEVAAVGADPSHRLAATVTRAGASEFFVLTEDYDLLRSWLREQAVRLETRNRRTRFADVESSKYRFDGILGESSALAAALDRVARVIPHPNVPVLLTGETGTGKELVARSLHYNGPRRSAPFVDVNCAAIPEQLLESELFGHEKGAFTNASSMKPGLFELARGGTIFLDEIGHLPLALQGKLLRVLQERQVRRVGGTKPIAVDVRVVAATHVDLPSAVRRGEFREDLYYRLNVLPVELPPLRQRREDVILLARHFLASFAKEYDRPGLAFTSRAEQDLQARDWPGNIRQLRNTLERAVLLARGVHIDAGDFEPETEERTSRSAHELPFPGPLAALTHAAVQATLERCGGNKSEAARRLVISRTRLQRLLDSGGDEADPDSESVGGRRAGLPALSLIGAGRVERVLRA
jgi:DNA-binding NtrC family response regulator